MKTTVQAALFLTVVCCALAATAPPAYAYVDPGSGSLVIQLLLGGVASAAVLLKHYWRRVTMMFGGARVESNESDAEIKPDAGER